MKNSTIFIWFKVNFLLQKNTNENYKQHVCVIWKSNGTIKKKQFPTSLSISLGINDMIYEFFHFFRTWILSDVDQKHKRLTA